jgi:hypothetical protein
MVIDFKNLEEMRFESMKRRQTVLFSNGDYYLIYRYGSLVWQNSHRTIKIKMPLSDFNRFMSHFRIAERFMRLTPRCAVRLNEHTFLISFNGKILRFDTNNETLVVEHSYRIGMHNPLSFTYINNISGFDDCIAYGEYFMNPNKTEVAIMVRKKKGQWISVYKFKGSITHIHNIIPDAKNSCVYILTGDEDSESAIWVAKNNFAEIFPLLKGQQKYRSCVAFPTNIGLIYATDTPLAENSIYNVDIKPDGCFVTKIYDMPGPCIYGTKVGSYFLFATSVEPDSSLPIWHYLFSRKLAPGIRDQYVHIIFGNSNEGFHEILKLKKDYLPMVPFQFGNVQFATCEKEDFAVLMPMAVKQYDGIPLLLFIENKNEKEHSG